MLRKKTDLSVGGIKGWLRSEQKLAYDMRPEDRRLSDPPAERMILTIAPSSKKCSISEVLLPDCASSLFLANGGNLS